MEGILLDTHVLVRWRSSSPFPVHILEQIALAKEASLVHLSPISAWELGIAQRKKNLARRPNLQGMDPKRFFASAASDLNANTVLITPEIATEAASVASAFYSGDPGDCFLIATAHLLRLTLVTTDGLILRFAQAHPTYITTLRC